MLAITSILDRFTFEGGANVRLSFPFILQSQNANRTEKKQIGSIFLKTESTLLVLG